ncbi:hypothetical protein [Flammeovirga aprica]|uniref:Uncharacterized protein n=1 Tax=Flammeovirga aprica JL-4 TaxID=694437 RepID=A0A7X9NZ56_9BACT|nr:hypothetical protein [Flammeovirga aprica]NME66611.1 hypothetical protein [Flammeovirga aprica JL-4]
MKVVKKQSKELTFSEKEAIKLMHILRECSLSEKMKIKNEQAQKLFEKKEEERKKRINGDNDYTIDEYREMERELEEEGEIMKSLQELEDFRKKVHNIIFDDIQPEY